MNINDVETPKEAPIESKDIWNAIFNKQRELAIKYQEIENMGDLFDTTDTNIDTAKGQKWIKDFAWRVTEELAEAYEAKDIDPEHYKEELIDALHFLVELNLIAGVQVFKPTYMLTPSSVVSWDVVYPLGLMCNTLKNKPWKQTQMLTDRKEFFKYLQQTWDNMFALLRKEIGSEEAIYLYYFKKNEVNKFRQRSKY